MVQRVNAHRASPHSQSLPCPLPQINAISPKDKLNSVSVIGDRQEVDFSLTTLKGPAIILSWTLKSGCITRRKTVYSQKPTAHCKNA
jgi:hypothetical protein